jgi:AbrB family looped-hinge helix DNA binding protein
MVITSKGQITIPASVRKRLNWKTGQKLRVDESAPYLTIVPDFDVEEMKSVIGCAEGAWEGKSSMEWLNETRGRVHPRKRRK